MQQKDRTTVVLLHGFGEDHTIFNHQIQELSSKYDLFTPDLPGSGVLNAYQWEEHTDTVDWLANWVFHQLVKRKVSRCIMLGHSMGGYITLAFAALHPEMLRGFGLLQSTAFADTPEKIKIRQKAITFMQKKGAFPFLKASVPTLFSSTFTQQHPEYINQLIEKAKTFTSSSMIAYYRAVMHRPNRTEMLTRANVPVLIIAATHDRVIPVTDLLMQAKMPSICHFHLLKDVGHMAMVEDKSQFNQILLHFLSSI